MKLAICHPERKQMGGKWLCKNCYDKHLKAINPTYKERQLLNHRNWSKIEIEKRHIYEAARKVKELADPDYKKKRRAKWLWKIYKITLEQYEQMLKDQNNSCKLCFRKQGKFSFHVDHCHKSDKVRGILCHQCNWYLGTIEEDFTILTRIKEYLGIL